MDTPRPFMTVTKSTAAYATLLTLAQKQAWPSTKLVANLKAIGSLHATVTTGLALYALSKPWPVHEALRPLNLGLGKGSFDDSANPMIAGHNALGNAVTALETGYLLFDTLALVCLSRRVLKASSAGQEATLAAAVKHRAKNEPLTLFHHVSLLAALGTLQYFIAQGKERGVYIITTLLLMNASTPLLHLRWWRRKVTGRDSLALDGALAFVFMMARLGSVLWVLKRYAMCHGLFKPNESFVQAGKDLWQIFRGQRWICQLSTGALLWMNGMWLATLLNTIVDRLTRRLRCNGSSTN